MAGAGWTVGLSGLRLGQRYTAKSMKFHEKLATAQEKVELDLHSNSLLDVD